MDNKCENGVVNLEIDAITYADLLNTMTETEKNQVIGMMIGIKLARGVT